MIERNIMKNIIIIKESLRDSLLKDLGTFGGLVACIAAGVWIDSSALQWIGGIMWIFAVIVSQASKDRNMTVEEAKAYLETLE